MQSVSFTLIDAFNQYWAVCEEGDRKAISCAGLTYFYLCKVWNTTGRSSSFRKLSTIMCAELLISKPTLDRHRHVLQAYGLIEFISGGSGNINTIYKILDIKSHKKDSLTFEERTLEVIPEVTPEVTKEVKQEEEKENNFTSGVTTHITSTVTSGDAYKQSKSTEKEKEFFVVVAGEIKKISFFENFFINDAGIQICYKEQGLPPGKILLALESWMIQNHGKSYDEIEKVRKHFIFWLPYYKIQNKHCYETKRNYVNPKPITKGRKTDSDYATGL